jgi:hypothetical protein
MGLFWERRVLVRTSNEACSGNEGLVRGGKYPYTHSSLACVDKKRTNSANPKPVDIPFLHHFQIGACQIVRSVVTQFLWLF